MAGCSALVEFISGLIFDDVNVVNLTQSPVQGSITVTDPAGETVLDTEFDLEGTEEPPEADEEVEDDELQGESWDDVLTEAGSYPVAVEIDDGTEAVGAESVEKTVEIDDPDEEDIVAFLTGLDVDPIEIQVIESVMEIDDTLERVESAN